MLVRMLVRVCVRHQPNPVFLNTTAPCVRLLGMWGAEGAVGGCALRVEVGRRMKA